MILTLLIVSTFIRYYIKISFFYQIITMKTILIPTDFSEEAHDALLYAIPYAQEWDASLLLLHVYPPPSGPDTAWVFIESERENWEKGAKTEMKKLVDEVEKVDVSLTCEVMVRQGPLVSEIVTLVKEKGIDMIIMGTQGARGLEKALVGTSTASVVSRVKCPVVAVPKGYKSTKLQKIVFASDYQEEDIEVISEIARLASRFNASLIILHVATDIGEYEDQKFDWYKEQVKEKIPYNNISFELIKHFDIQEGIEDFIKYHEVDLLSMSMRKRNIFDRIFGRSETKEMTYHTQIPLLAYHAEAIAVPKAPGKNS